MSTEPSQIIIRRDTSSQWADSNPVLGAGEPGINTTTNELRVGNGTTPYLGLPVFAQFDPTSGEFSPAAQEVLDGRYGAIATPASFGAVGDGVADDADAVVAAITSGRPLDWGGPERTYRITKTVSAVLTAQLSWRSAGARILVDSAASIQRAVSIDTNGFGVTIDGPLTVDAARKAFTGWYFWTTSTTRANFTAVRLGVRNVYRASTAMVGGDGIWISGGYDNVYLERPDIRDIVMAAGAGVAGSQGVAGITVKSQGPGLAPTEISIVHPWVSNVYSEDTTYLMDQDGIRLFTEEDNGDLQLFDTHFVVMGGTFKNCRGRSIKSQCEFGSVTGTKFIRDATQLAIIGGAGIMPEIDFQVGGGIVAQTEHRYRSAAPICVVQASGTRQVGGKYSTGVQVDGVKVSRNGTSSARPSAFLKINLFEQLQYVADVANVQYIDNGNYLGGNFVELTGANTSAEAHVRLTNIAAPIPSGSALFYRTAAIAVPVFVSITNAANLRSGTPAPALTGGAVSGGTTVATSGQQVRFA